MNPKLIKILKILLPLLLGVFLIWYSINSATPKERETTINYILKANPIWVLLSVVLGLISHFLRAYRWKFLLSPMGYVIKTSNSFMAVMAGYLANLGVPRSGELLRGGIIATYERIPFKKAFGTIISERVIDLIMLLIIVGVTVILQTEKLISFLGDKIADPVISLGALLLLIGFGIVAIRIFRNSDNSFIIKIRQFGEGILEGVKSIYKIKNKKAFILHTILIWVLYIIMFNVIKYTLPETSDLGLGPILVTFVAGSLAMSLTNGGIGAFPLAIAYSLALFDIDLATGTAFGWILWGSQTAINILIGALSFFFLPILNREKIK